MILNHIDERLVRLERILLLASGFSAIGGIEGYTQDVLACLESMPEVAISCVTFHSSAKTTLSGPCGATAHNRGIATIWKKLLFLLRSLIAVHRIRPRQIICSHLAPSPVARVLATTFNSQYHIFLYGIEAWGHMRLRERWAMKKAANIIVISQFMRRWLIERYNMDPRTIRVLPPSVNTNEFRPLTVSEDAKAAFGLCGKRVVLIVSRLSSAAAYKGHDRVIAALPAVRQRISSIVYVIAGEGDDRRRLEALAEARGVSDCVLFLGRVTHNDLLTLYNICEIFVMPSRFRTGEDPQGEGFGIVYIEAAACAKPSIAGKLGPSAEVVLDGKTGVLVDPDSVEEISRAILALLSDDVLRESLGQNAYARTLSNYNSEVFCQTVRNIFLGLLPQLPIVGESC